MHLIPRCKHGPFCTGGPMHSPLIPVGPIERAIARVFPPHSMEEANRLYQEHISRIARSATAEPGLSTDTDRKAD